MNKINFQCTVGYKAVICIDVKAENEAEAKQLALKEMGKLQDRAYTGKVILQDDNYKIDGILNMDETWKLLNN